VDPIWPQDKQEGGRMKKRGKMQRRYLHSMVIWIFLVLMSLGVRGVFAADAKTVIVFAAASTTNAMTDIARLFEEQSSGAVIFSFASSSTLAKQIENGAPADIYLSADQKWMDYLAEKGVIIAGSRFDLLGNRIVLIVPVESSVKKVLIDAGLDIVRLLGDGHFAMGDPDHVPVGIYGKQAFEKLGLWNSLKDKVACTSDVRAALVMVERSEVPLGLVYATDAAISKKVKTIGIFPEDSHPPIVYPASMIRETDMSRKFFDFLKTKTATDIFRKYGFSVR
jgi:molybdate transport system substrate-binding protein